MDAHTLLLEPRAELTVARCSCGHWSREADIAVVALTGRSRVDALRAAHELHARGIDAIA